MKVRALVSRTGLTLVFLVLTVLLVKGLFTWGGSLEVLSGVVTRQALPLLLMAVALGTDAMSLSIGIGMRGVSWREVARVSLVIGIFHVLMPLAGAAGGFYFGLFAGEIAHWIGAGIVAFIGVRMIWGCLGNKQTMSSNWTLSGVPLLMLALSVSLDALSVGFSLGAFGYNIFITSLVFGVFGAGMTALGLLFGSRLGKLIGDRGELLGGAVLIILALHMLLER